MNVIARLEYELAYYDSAVHRFNHYTTRTPLYYFWVKGFDIRRELQSFYSGFFICPPSCAASATKVSASKRKPTVFPQSRSHLNSLTFLNLPKSTSRFWCVTSFTLSSLHFPSRAIVTSLHDMSALPAHAWTPALMLHLSNPCTEPKGSQPN